MILHAPAARRAALAIWVLSASVLASPIVATGGNLDVQILAPPDHASISLGRDMLVIVRTIPQPTCQIQFTGARIQFMTLPKRRANDGGYVLWRVTTIGVGARAPVSIHAWCSLNGDKGDAQVAVTLD